MGFRCSLCCLVKGCRPTWLSGMAKSWPVAACSQVRSSRQQNVKGRPLMEPAFADLACGTAKWKGASPSILQLGRVVVAAQPFSYLGTPQTAEGEASFAGSPSVPQ